MASERKDGVLAAITLSNIPSEFRGIVYGISSAILTTRLWGALQTDYSIKMSYNIRGCF